MWLKLIKVYYKINIYTYFRKIYILGLTTGYICNAKYTVFDDIAKCYKDNNQSIILLQIIYKKIKKYKIVILESTSNDLYLIL